jgi:recombination protein RecT
MGRVSQQVEQQGVNKEQREELEGRITGARAWFNSVVPSHINPDQFVALCLGALRKDPDLQAAAVANPGPFMVAASDCARMGLIPGETFHFVAFNNRETGLKDITGIVDYKGEIDMIYRAGGVTAVHCQVVRATDHFVWRPGMEIPEHVIKENEHLQVGLADDSDRGPLTGVYAYARLLDGGVSEPIVMARSVVMQHKAAAKSKKFWDGPWEPDMWLKTAVHKLYDRVPHSQEYMAERMRAANAAPIPGGGQPALGGAALGLPTGGTGPVPRQAGELTPPGGGGSGGRKPEVGSNSDDDPGRWPEGATPAPPAAGQAQAGTPAEDSEQRRTALLGCYDLFAEHQLEGEQYGPHRTALLASAAVPEGQDPLRITAPAQLDTAQAVAAHAVLDALTRRWAADGEDVRANLLVEADRVLAVVRPPAGQDSEQAPAAASRAGGSRGRQAKGAKGGSDDAS